MTQTHRPPSDSPPPTVAPIAAPTAAGERLDVLDVLRGIALYGVLLANTVPWFSGMAFMPRDQVMAHRDGADRAFLFLLNVLCDGKAMMLLTFLFGIGFSLQLQRAERSGRSVVPTYVRRLCALAFIGFCHVLLLWWGDILWGYAIAGFGLLFFRKLRGPKLLIWGLVLMLVPAFLASLPPIGKVLEPLLQKPADLPGFRAQVLAAIVGDSRRLLTIMHFKQTFYHVGRFWPTYFFDLLGRFLIGYWAGTTGLFHHPEKHLPLFRKLAIIGISLGLLGALSTTALRTIDPMRTRFPDVFWSLIGLPAEVAVMLLTCGYAAVVVLLMQRSASRRALLVIAPVGQMALTTYIMQSLLSTFLFYGWGLGLATHVKPARLLPITLALFAVQIVFARLWLSRFRFGPLEWLWRSMSYGRLQPLRRTERA